MHATRSGEYSLDPCKKCRNELSISWLFCRTASVCKVRKCEKQEEREKGDEREWYREVVSLVPVLLG